MTTRVSPMTCRGEISFVADGVEVASDTVVVPPGTVQQFANAGDATTHVLVEGRSALRMEGLLETASVLAREGCTDRKGIPRPLELALFVREFEQEERAPLVPC